jgi:YgiT-type zinc finger domain-containing protein
MKCPNCDATMSEGVEDYRYTESGFSNVILQGVTVRRCPKCGEGEVAVQAMAKLHRLLASKVARRSELLSGEEIRLRLQQSGNWEAEATA